MEYGVWGMLSFPTICNSKTVSDEINTGILFSDLCNDNSNSNNHAVC
jgi:hypothetical protein